LKKKLTTRNLIFVFLIKNCNFTYQKKCYSETVKQNEIFLKIDEKKLNLTQKSEPKKNKT